VKFFIEGFIIRFSLDRGTCGQNCWDYGPSCFADVKRFRSVGTRGASRLSADSVQLFKTDLAIGKQLQGIDYGTRALVKQQMLHTPKTSAFEQTKFANAKPSAQRSRHRV